MRAFINGQFVPADQAKVSIFDRGFLYGDGLFEAIRVVRSRPFRWEQHVQRLARGAEYLGIALPYSADDLRNIAKELMAGSTGFDGLLRITLSRGVGQRGYSPAGADSPTLAVALHELPATPASVPVPRWKLVTASLRLPAGEPLAQFKTCNKLAQILARAEADAAGAHEALLLNTDGYVVEGSTSNLFWIEDGVVCTPPLASGILAGVTRSVVLEICGSLGVETREKNTTAVDLKTRDGVFVSLSSFGVVVAESLDGVALRQSAIPGKIGEAYAELLKHECGR